MSCKKKECKHKASKPSGFCGWCDRKFQKGEIKADGSPVVCKGASCSRPPKTSGFCGWCLKKVNRGELDANGDPSLKEKQKQQKRKARESKRLQRQAKTEAKKLKEEIKLLLSAERLKVLQQEPTYRETFFCDAYGITISPAECYGRLFVRDHPPKKCKKCEVHNANLVTLKTHLVEKNADT